MDILQGLLADIFGGHEFPLTDDYEDWTVCLNCFGDVSMFELEEGLWPARLGRYCPEVLFRITPTPMEKK